MYTCVSILVISDFHSTKINSLLKIRYCYNFYEKMSKSYVEIYQNIDAEIRLVENHRSTLEEKSLRSKIPVTEEYIR